VTLHEIDIVGLGKLPLVVVEDRGEDLKISNRSFNLCLAILDVLVELLVGLHEVGSGRLAKIEPIVKLTVILTAKITLKGATEDLDEETEDGDSFFTIEETTRTGGEDFETNLMESFDTALDLLIGMTAIANAGKRKAIWLGFSTFFWSMISLTRRAISA